MTKRGRKGLFQRLWSEQAAEETFAQNEMELKCHRGDFTSKGSETRQRDFGETERRPVSMKQERRREDEVRRFE